MLPGASGVCAAACCVRQANKRMIAKQTNVLVVALDIVAFPLEGLKAELLPSAGYGEMTQLLNSRQMFVNFEKQPVEIPLTVRTYGCESAFTRLPAARWVWR